MGQRDIRSGQIGKDGIKRDSKTGHRTGMTAALIVLGVSPLSRNPTFFPATAGKVLGRCDLIY